VRREQERQELLKENNLQLARLADNFRLALPALEAFTGAEFGRALDLIRQQLGFLGGLGGIIDLGGLTPERITEQQMAFLQEVAASFGLTVDGSVESLRDLQEAIRGLDLARLTETFTGAMDLLQRRFAIFDIDKPVDRLVEMLGLLEEFGAFSLAGFEGLPDATTEAGRAALEALIRAIFTDIEAGTFDVSRLGGLTLEQLLDLLGEMEKLLDDLGEEGGITTDEGLTENFVRTTRITEVQGSRLLAIQDTMLVLGRRRTVAVEAILSLLTTMAAIPPPAPSAVGDVARAGLPGQTGVTVGQVNVEATINVTEAVDADALVERIGADLAASIDRSLSELQTREDRAVGDTDVVA
jgi:hypothetical protein